ncbi:Flavanone 3-dioxygenase 3 [Sesamum alatum]|uniref:Flavanone 3-dioxygenase 3 n=1 Tax=Sesamum alatum TaxID=300844 RepID=A0AAE1XLI2_9LAMI|nr:Flavanone 3-dioxygenase 3 [Sesamum alatum]
MEENLEISADDPIIDLSPLHHNPLFVIKKIHEACRRCGFFHVINHGVADSVIEEALNVNRKFFELPTEIKEELWSDDVQKVVRFGEVEVGGISREFLKLYAHPLHQYVSSWPKLPLHYRERMGLYATEVRKLSIELFGAIMESLNLSETHLKQNFEQGIQILGINSYSPCSGPNATTGLPPHTDHSLITVLLQSGPGLQVIDCRSNMSVGGLWKNVPRLNGSFQVLVGDHLEVLSNGLYKSVVHRAIPSCSNTRLSIANLHSLRMDEIVEPAGELQENEGRYKGSSLRDFLKHLASRDTRPFIETLRIDQVES